MGMSSGVGAVTDGIWGKTAERVGVQKPNIVDDSYDVYRYEDDSNETAQ